MHYVVDFRKQEMPTAWYWNPEKNDKLEEGGEIEFPKCHDAWRNTSSGPFDSF